MRKHESEFNFDEGWANGSFSPFTSGHVINIHSQIFWKHLKLKMLFQKKKGKK